MQRSILKSKGINIPALAGLLFSLLIHAGCLTLRGPRSAYKRVAERRQHFDAIIVPGIPFDGHTWSATMRSRVLWSCFLYRKGYARNIIYSGSAVYSPYYEAKIMGLYAQQLGIPAEHIFYDTLAEHSTENVYYSYELARKKGFRTLALATEYNQALPLKGFIRRRFGSRIEILPVIEDTIAEWKEPDPVIDPAPAHKKDFVSIMEREGFLKRLKGTLGHNIPWEKGKKRKAAPL